MNNKQLIDEHLHAYSCEAFVSLIFDLIAIGMLWGIPLILFLNHTIEIKIETIIIFCCFTILYLTASFAVNYRILLLCYIDKHQNNVVSETVTLTEIKQPLTIRENRISNNISIFYDKRLNVQKYKLMFQKKDNSVSFVRVILSDIKYHKTCSEIINNPKIDKVSISYYKHSKLLISVSLPKDKSYSLEDEQKIRRFNKTI